MVTRMQQRRGTASQWTTANTVLAAGEIGFETDTNKFKIGDGSTAWNSLPYFVNKNDIETGLLDTDEVSEGTINLYFTAQRAIDAVAGGSFTTDAVEEGTTNLYYTDARVETVIDNSTTDNISEGTTNLYFTDQRAIDAVGENLALNDLSDVATAGVADGDALVYDTATTSWVPGSVAIDALNDIADVNITTPANGEVLVYDNGNWINQEASGGGIKDIATSSANKTLSLEDAGDLILVQNPQVVNAELSATTWTTRNTNYGNIAVDNLSYGNGLWVANGAYSNTIKTSTDIISWTTQSSNFSSLFIMSMAYGGNNWVAVNLSGQLRSSTNGTTWVTQNSNFGSTSIYSVVYENNTWLASGSSGQIRTSTDTISWTTSESGISSTITAAEYGNGKWVVNYINNGVKALESTDAITWTTNPLNVQVNDDNPGFKPKLLFANNTWLFAAEKTLLNSTDATTWTTQTFISLGTYENIFKLAHSDGLWVAGTTAGKIATSTDTISWVSKVANIGTTRIQSLAYGNSLWVAGGYGGQFSTSNQILEDSDVTITIPSNDSVAIPVKTQVNVVRKGTGDVVFASEQEVVGQEDGDLIFNSSGVTWNTVTTSPSPILGGAPIGALQLRNNVYIAGSIYGDLATSTDAVTWVTRTLTLGGSTASTKDIEYANGVWVICGDYGVGIQTSTNTINWTSQSSNFSSFSTVWNLAYGNNVWVAVGDSGQLRTSTNAINWTTRTSNMTDRIEKSVYGNNIFVIAGGGGNIRSSTDGVSWTTRTSNLGSTIGALAYGNGLWLAGSYTSIRSSTDTVTWTTADIGFGNTSTKHIAYGGGLWTALNTGGQIRTSTDTITWITRANIGNALNAIDFSYENKKWIIENGTNNIRVSENVYEQVDVFADTVTLNSSSGLKLRDQWSVATAIKTGTDEWLITGDLSE